MNRHGVTYESLQAEEFGDGGAFQDLTQPYEGPLTDPFFYD